METKKQTPFLDFYNKHVAYGKIPSTGLCYSIREGKDLFKLITPSKEDDPEHWEDGFIGYWAYDGEPLTSHFMRMYGACKQRGISMDEARYDFTEFRQTVILLCAAMNNEL